MSNKVSNIPATFEHPLYSNVDFYKTAGNLTGVIQDYIEVIELNITYAKNKSSGNFYEKTKEFYNNLNNTLSNIPNDQKYFFIERFLSLADKLKTNIKNNLLDNKYFKEFSDDTGILFDVFAVMNNTVAPFYDTFFEDIDELPTNLPSTVLNKTSTNNKVIQKTASLKCDGLFRKNMKGIFNYNSEKISKTSHGDNLVTDYYYFSRLYKIKQPLINSIFNLLKEIAEVIYFFKTLNERDNLNKSFYVAYDAKIEQTEKKVDLLMNKLASTPYINQEVLYAV